MRTHYVEATYTVSLTPDELRAIHWAIAIAQSTTEPNKPTPAMKEVLNHLVEVLPLGISR